MGTAPADPGVFIRSAGMSGRWIIGNRRGLARPLFFSLFAMAVIIGMLATGFGNIKVMLSLFSFNRLWIFIDVYQMATVANIDHSGSFASLMPGAQGLGQIVGPYIAASILGANLGYSAVFVRCGTIALAGLSVCALIYVRIRKDIPTLADAS
jgi:hypothetical protein